jgi:hypothetical protein
VTETELELFKANARIVAVESVLTMLLGAVSSTPAARKSLLEALDRLPENTRLLPLKGLSPEMADLLTAEAHEATESLVQFLKDNLQK